MIEIEIPDPEELIPLWVRIVIFMQNAWNLKDED